MSLLSSCNSLMNFYFTNISQLSLGEAASLDGYAAYDVISNFRNQYTCIYNPDVVMQLHRSDMPAGRK